MLPDPLAIALIILLGAVITGSVTMIVVEVVRAFIAARHPGPDTDEGATP